MCLKCKKPYCSDCEEITQYSGLCLLCEREKQLRIVDRLKQKKVRYISNMIACFLGAIMFLCAMFLFDNFKSMAIIGSSVLGFVGVIFAVLFVEKIVKIKSATKMIDTITSELKKATQQYLIKNDDTKDAK